MSTTKKAQQIAADYSLDLLLLFGSQVSGNTHAESDYDVAYLSRHTLTLEDEGRLINELMPVVGAQDERDINLVDIKKASPLLLYAITKACKVLYERESTDLATLRAAAFKKYVEMKPVYRERARRLRNRILSP